MGAPNFANRTLYYGDNLPALRRMNSETVHLIATDPPFKKQRGFFSDAGGYDDRWTWQRDILGLDRKGNAVAENHDDWVDQIQDDWPGAWMVIAAARSTYGDDMGAFLCWLGVRLMELRRILRNDGSIYVHMDETAVHYVKALMDAIFGKENRLNGIVWRRTYAHGGAKKWGPVHDTILFYAKSSEYVWNPVYQDYDKSYLDKYYRFSDARGRYRLVTLTGAGVTKSGDSGLPWRGWIRRIRGGIGRCRCRRCSRRILGSSWMIFRRRKSWICWMRRGWCIGRNGVRRLNKSGMRTKIRVRRCRILLMI